MIRKTISSTISNDEGVSGNKFQIFFVLCLFHTILDISIIFIPRDYNAINFVFIEKFINLELDLNNRISLVYFQ